MILCPLHIDFLFVKAEAGGAELGELEVNRDEWKDPAAEGTKNAALDAVGGDVSIESTLLRWSLKFGWNEPLIRPEKTWR